MILKTYRSLIALLLLLLLSERPVQAQSLDEKILTITSTYTVKVHYIFDADLFFPNQWSQPAINAKGQQADLANVERLLPIIQDFLSDHPAHVIQNNLDHIYILGELTCAGKVYGGTHEGKSIYLPCKNAADGYTTEFLEQRLHSEFSSILFNHHPFPSSKWIAVNNPQFHYSGTGFEAIDNPTRYRGTTSSRANGFLLNYSRSSLENDFNMISAWLFTQPGELQAVCNKFPKIQQKEMLTESYYKSISAEYIFP